MLVINVYLFEHLANYLNAQAVTTIAHNRNGATDSPVLKVSICSHLFFDQYATGNATKQERPTGTTNLRLPFAATMYKVPSPIYLSKELKFVRLENAALI